ncbi:hypothetical protein TEHD86_1351 [Tetragenococcus halophilus subsp. halophilus]|uniref:glucose PTS transporter subunit EIIB n=1 Tax=Tetragenococcus halophilus TaxID=51669 RepID=UPI000CADCA36|nr:glucose PTS transporter subunit EIIB [Tetragenococcus halophilus]GBD82629.1 hypothetical protein TEHD86_1351 [Tetragenococcus halophilus subsp. halophilus]
MFISPMMYFIHSLLAGVAGFVTYSLKIRIGFSFGGNIIDYILGYNIGDNVLLIIPVGIIFFFIYYFIFYYLITKMDIETLGREKETNYTEEKSEEEKDLSLNTGNYEYLAKKLLEALGGKDNIDDIYNCVTRIRVTVNQPDLVNEERIKQTGISGIVKPSESHFQIVIGPEVTSVMREMNKLLDE